MQTWAQWQGEVVAALRQDLDELLSCISIDDVDWASFHTFFLEGRTARAAVNRALERDL